MAQSFLPQDLYKQLYDSFLDPDLVENAKKKYGEDQVMIAVRNGFRAFMSESNLADVVRDGTGNRLKSGLDFLYQGVVSGVLGLNDYVKRLHGENNCSPYAAESERHSLEILRSVQKNIRK